jgi:hypothetical protein
MKFIPAQNFLVFRGRRLGAAQRAVTLVAVRLRVIMSVRSIRFVNLTFATRERDK